MNRSPLNIALPLLMLAGLCLARGGTAQDAPVLLTESFDVTGEQVPAGWKNDSSGELQVTLAGEARRPRQGMGSWRMRVPAWEAGQARVTHGGIPLKATGNYGLEVWLRGDGLDQPVTVSLHKAGRNGQSYLTRQFHVSGEWKRCVIQGRAPMDDPATELSISFTGTGGIWMDGLRLVQGELPDPSDDADTKPAKPGKDGQPVAPVYRKGNRLYNSSFELGTDGWTIPEHIAVVANDSPQGEHFARWLPNPYPLECQPFSVRPGQPYTFSAYLRSQRPGARVEISANEVGNGARVARTFDLTADWRRYTFTSSLPCERYAKYFLTLKPAQEQHGFDVDAVQVEEGPLTDYAAPIEVSTGLKRSDVFPEPDTMIGVPAQVYAPCKTPEGASLVYRLTGFYGELLGITRVPLKAGLNRAEVPFRLRMPMQGSLRLDLQVQVGGETVSSTERMLCVLPALDNTAKPDSFFGGHGSVGTAGEWHAPTIASRAGIRWWRLHDLGAYTAWAVAEPTNDHFQWYDREVAALRSRGLSVLGVFERTAPWAGTDPGGASSDSSAWPPARMSDLSNYVRSVVNHYRGQISAYEIWNEPWAHASWAGTPEQYVELAKAASAAARAADPRVELVGGSLWVPRPQFTDRVLGKGLLSAVDGVSMHEYTEPEAVTFTENGHDQVTNWTQSLRGKLNLVNGEKHALWNTEGGMPCPSYYSWLGAEEQSRSAARSLAKTLILAKANGVRRFFYYHVWGEDGGPRLMDWLYDNNWALLDYDGGGKPTLAALAGCAQRLEGAQHAGRLETADLKAYLFRRGADTVLAAWSPTALNTPIQVKFDLHPHAVSAFTLMGNTKGLQTVAPIAATAAAPAVLPSVTVSLRDEPCYLVFRGMEPPAVLKALKVLSPDAPKADKPAGANKPKPDSGKPGK